MIRAHLGAYRGWFEGCFFAVLSTHLSNQSSIQTQKKEHFCSSLQVPFKHLLKTIKTLFKHLLQVSYMFHSDLSSSQWSDYRHSSRCNTPTVLNIRLYVRPPKSLSERIITSLWGLFSRARSASVCLACLYVCACVIIRRAALLSLPDDLWCSRDDLWW